MNPARETGTEHTALPWTTQGTGQIFDIYGNEIAECKRHGAGIVPQGYVCPWHSYEANAALIVRAVNSHRDLVAALSVTTEALRALAEDAGDVPEFNHGGIAFEALQQARQALAKAEGRT